MKFNNNKIPMSENQDKNPFAMSFKQKLNLFITIISVIVSYGGIAYFFWGVSLIYFFLALSIYILIVYGIFYLYKVIRKQERPFIKPFFVKWYIRFARLMLLLIIILFGFIKFQNDWYPVSTPLYTLTNGTKTIKFQTIMHVGTQDYYDQILKELTESKKQGYVLYYEGVKLDDVTQKDKFNTALGIDFSESFYESFSKLYGLQNQDNNMFLNVVNSKDYNVDMTISEVINLYEQKYGPIIVDKNQIVNLTDIMVQRLSQLNDKQLILLRAFFKSSINFMTKHDSLKEIVVKVLKVDKMINIILEERNKLLAETLMKSKHNKIHVLYGNLHFKGTFIRMHQENYKWTVSDRKEFYPTK